MEILIHLVWGGSKSVFKTSKAWSNSGTTVENVFISSAQRLIPPSVYSCLVAHRKLLSSNMRDASETLRHLTMYPLEVNILFDRKQNCS